MIFPHINKFCGKSLGRRDLQESGEIAVVTPDSGAGIPRLLPDPQLELFPGVVPYLSQADAASALGITARVIQYWEAQGLLHPEQPQERRNRRYTPRDLVELRFIKGMVVDRGYTVPALKEKLARLPAPYYYDPSEVFWDPRDERWKSRRMLAMETLLESQEELIPALARAIEKLTSGAAPSDQVARAVLELVREGLAGRVRRAGRRR